MIRRHSCCAVIRIAFLALLIGNRGLFAAPSFAAERAIRVEEAIEYGKAGDVPLLLDMALPADGETEGGETTENAKPRPAIILIHGGGWTQGARSDFHPLMREAAQRGYVAASISYRLMKIEGANTETPTAAPNFPTQVHDCKTAVRWLRANAEKYGVDPDRIGVMGGSAGGHLALMLGLTAGHEELEGNGGHADRSSRVQAVVNVFGPTEMVSCYEQSSVLWLFPLFLGGKPDEAAEQYKLASPLTHVHKEAPPVLTLHGDRDHLVPIEQAKMLDARMKEAGAAHTLLILEGQGHGFQGEHLERANAAMWDFFERHLQRPMNDLGD